MKIKLSKSQWEMIGKVAGWRDEERNVPKNEIGEDLLDIAFLDPKRFKDAIRSNPEACELVEGIIKSQMEKGYSGPHKQIIKKKII